MPTALRWSRFTCSAASEHLDDRPLRFPYFVSLLMQNLSAVSGAARRACCAGMSQAGPPGRFRYGGLKEAVLEDGLWGLNGWVEVEAE